MTTIKAIETRYAGCHFRSRLEARWAVLFDRLDIAWEYESQGYEIGDAHGPSTRYLPDFYLPAAGQWVEVKASDELLDKPLMVRCVDDWSGAPLPGLTDSAYGGDRGLVLLGPIPRPGADNRMPAFTILGHGKGVYHHPAALDAGTFRRLGRRGCGMDAVIGTGDSILNGCQCPWIAPNQHVRGENAAGEALARRVNQALTAARSARFEHGQAPQQVLR